MTAAAPLWEVFDPRDGRPLGYARAWHYDPAIAAVAQLAGTHRILDAELVPLEIFDTVVDRLDGRSAVLRPGGFTR